MRWIKQEKEIFVPKDNEERTIEKFLFRPMCINNEYRWLEKVKIQQQYIGRKYHKNLHADGFYVSGGFWRNIKYVS